MKKVEVKLSLSVVAPLLDVIKAAADTLQDDLAASITFEEVDHDLRDSWRAELLDAQNQDVKVLLALFDSEFFASGVVSFDEANADAIVRACASVRLRLRQRFLATMPDDLLESGDVELETLPEGERRAFMCYLFLATVQELIIQHLDASILEG
jgi:hypothetical protein